MSIANLRTLYLEAQPVERRKGVEYYRNQHNCLLDLGAKYGFPLQSSAGAFAALSPLSKESDTYSATERCMKWAQAGSVGSPPDCGLIKNRTKALMILQGANPRRVLATGPKVLSFFYNTMDPVNPRWVTVDGHMVSAWNGGRLKLKSQAGITRKVYERVQRDVISVAREVELIPCQFQSIIWVVQRRINRHGNQGLLDLDFLF